jgi:hypothetical protein
MLRLIQVIAPHRMVLCILGRYLGDAKWRLSVLVELPSPPTATGGWRPGGPQSMSDRD